MTTDTIGFSAIVLAAGTSSRMQGAHKLLLPVGEEPVIRRTVRAVLDAGPQELVVVTGYREAAVRDALAGLPVRLQANRAFEDGQMSSVAAGVAALTQATDAVMVCLGDMVLLTGDDYRELVRAFAALRDQSILVPQFQGQRGNPVVIAQWHLPQLLAGQRNLGCRKLVADYPQEVFAYEAAHDRFVSDMDTPQDYERILRRLESAGGSAQGQIA
ncbi:putative MobA-like protein [Burkholderiales bacterium]|nr:putative MobA-like protein [Burkholderiales bacterium]